MQENLNAAVAVFSDIDSEMTGLLRNENVNDKSQPQTLVLLKH